jgi:hypothetical protein
MQGQGNIHDAETCRKMYMSKLSGRDATEKGDSVFSSVGYLMMLCLGHTAFEDKTIDE